MASSTGRSPPATGRSGLQALALLAAPLVLALAVGPAPAAAAVKTYTFTLNGASAYPPSGSAGTGSATVTVDTIANTMRVQAAFSGLFGGALPAYISGPTAVANTGIANPTISTSFFTGFPNGRSGSYDHTFDMTAAGSYNPAYVTANGGTTTGAFAALVAAMDASKAYFNIRTVYSLSGEIRGFSVPVVGVTGDPHFTGFDGTPFFFEGRQGEVFNLLSERNTQVNALMGRIGPSMAGELSDVWMVGFGIRRGASMALQFRVDTDPARMHLMAEDRTAPGSGQVDTMFRAALPNEDSFLHIEVNGAHRDDLLYSGRTIGGADGGSGDIIDLGGATLHFPTRDTVNAEDARDGPLAIITTDKFRLTVLKETEGAIHLDLRVELLGAVEDMDGVLGQTLRWRAAGGPGGKVKDGVYAAGDDDGFRIADGLLGAKFSRNLFDPAANAPAAAAGPRTSRMLLMGGAARVGGPVLWAAAGDKARLEI